MRHSLLYTCLLLSALLVSCGKQPSFMIEGSLTDAGGKTMYLDELAISGTIVADSVVLPADGGFLFRHHAPEYSELYRLRCDGRNIIVAIDSTETVVVLGSWADPLNVDFVCKQGHAGIAAIKKSDAIARLRRSLLNSPLEQHKLYARQLIISDPRSIVAYYALFQQKAGQFVFDLYNKADRACFSAVATAWNAFMPDNPRSKAVYKLTLDAIKQERNEASRLNMQQFIANSENAFLNISLPDENGCIRDLESLRGKVFVLDFSAVGMEKASAYIFELRELYNAYHDRGLEIYSVSADNNRLLWEDTAHNLPWITVRGEKGVLEEAFAQYNVQHLPTVFLFDRHGEIVGRYADFDSLKKDIEQKLKQ